MANDVLNMLARSLLQIGGVSPQQIRQATRAGKPRKPMPKAKASKPAVTPKPATPTNVVGQTNLFNQSGKPRDFRNPAVSGNRPATVTKPAASNATLNPRPTYKPPVPQGQMSVFGTNPGAKPGGNFRAPSVPGPGAGTLKGTYGKDALSWLKANSAAAKEAAAVNRAVRAQSGSNALFGGLGVAAPILQLANMVQDRMLSPDQLKIKQANSIGRGNTGDFQTREQVLGRDQQYGPPSPQMYGPGGSATGSGLGQAQQVSPTSSVEPGGLFYRGNGQPAAAAPAPGPTAQPSVYAPRAERAPRPNTPVSASKVAAPSNPYAGIGDVRGNELGVMPDGSMGVDQKGLGQPLTPSDVDTERRRAFLDADNSIDGIKAVKDLLKRRKLSISVSD